MSAQSSAIEEEEDEEILNEDEDLNQKVDRIVEEEWADKVSLRNVCLGARTLCFLTIVVILTRVIYYLSYILDLIPSVTSSFAYKLDSLKKSGGSTQCTWDEWGRRRLSPVWVLLGGVAEIGIHLCMLRLLWDMCKDAKLKTYYVILLVWYIYVLIAALPPLRPSCVELDYLSMCGSEYHQQKSIEWMAVEGGQGILQALVDSNPGEEIWTNCLPQGHTCTQSMLAWIVITPRVVPVSKLMWTTLVAVWVGYFGIVVGINVWLQLKTKEIYPLHVRGLTLSQVIFDICVSMLILTTAALYASSKKTYLEKAQKTKFRWEETRTVLKQDLEEVLESMVPEHCLSSVMKLQPYFEHFAVASVLFVRIEDFEKTLDLLKGHPDKVYAYLNRHFDEFDKICSDLKVTKIETTGAEYICAVGVSGAEEEEGVDHSLLMDGLIQVANQMFEFCELEDQELPDHKTVLKMGIHTGPVVTGIAGKTLPRFLVLGDSMTVGCSMMQKGAPGRVQMTGYAHRHLPRTARAVKRDERVSVGRKAISTYWLELDSEAPPTERLRSQRRTHFGEADPTASTVTYGGLSAGSYTSQSEDGRSYAGVTVNDPTASEALLPDPAEERGPLVTEQPSDIVGIELSDLHPSRMAAPPPSETINSCLGPLQEEDEEDAERVPASSARSRPGGQVETSKSSRIESQFSSKPVTATSSGIDRLRTECMLRSTQRTGFYRLVNCCDYTRLLALTCFFYLRTFVNICMTLVLEWFKKRFSPGFGWDDDEEEDFIKWYHEDCFIKKLRPRLTKQAAALSFLTLLEVIFTVFYSKAFSAKHLFWEYSRLVVFVLTRFIAFLIVMGWRSICGDRWIRAAPEGVQKRMLYSYCLIVVLMFLSYDAITVRKGILVSPKEVDYKVDWDCCLEKEEMSSDFIKQRQTEAIVDMERKTHEFAVIFVFAYHLISTQVPFLFYSSAVFLFICMALVSIAKWCDRPDFRNMFFNSATSVLFVGTCAMNVYLAHSNEKNVRHRYRVRNQIKLISERFKKMQAHLLPPQVAELMEIHKSPSKKQLSHTYKTATVAKVNLMHFNQLVNKQKDNPEVVINTLNSILWMFEKLADEHKLWKLEIVGDSIIAGQAEHPLTEHNFPLSVVTFALAAVSSTHRWSRSQGQEISCRVGVHQGQVLGGIIGTKMHRYQLFGKLMLQVDILQATASRGKVHVSEACKRAVQGQIILGQWPPYRHHGTHREQAVFTEREEDELRTSKGDVHSFAEVGGRTYYAKLDIRDQDKDKKKL